jgi:hypothetical protein
MKITNRAPLLAAAGAIVLPLAASLFLSEAPAARATGPYRQRAKDPGLSQLRPRVMGPRSTDTDRRKFLRRVLPRLGSQAAFRKVAQNLGVTEWRGKRLDRRSRPSSSDAPRLLALDQPVDSFDGSQNQPTIAVDPTDDSVVVVFAQNEANFLGVDVACSIYLSFDGGVSFAYADDVPLVNADDTCAEPVVRFSPDGSVVYYNYLSIRAAGDFSDIMVAVAEGDDPTNIITGPTMVLPGGADFVDTNWLGVHTFDSADGSFDSPGHVYVTGTVFFDGGGCGLLVNRSVDYGVTWDFGGGAGMLFGGPTSDCDVSFLHGARVDGGPGGQVLACYYNSGTDGFAPDLLPPAPSNRFHITCVSSADHFDTPSAPITAAGNISYELNYYLGPNENYHLWWPGMLPSVAIDHQGVAHVAFAMDPNSNKVDAESGNVQYIRSTGSPLNNPPYTTWSGRMVIGSGGRAQGFPNVVAQRSNLTTKSYVYVAYYDHYRSTSAAPNGVYDVRYKKSTNGGVKFTGPFNVTEVVSLSDNEFIGIYFGTATTMRRFHLAWTDRGDKTEVDDFEDDVFADRY